MRKNGPRQKDGRLTPFEPALNAPVFVTAFDNRHEERHANHDASQSTQPNASFPWMPRLVPPSSIIAHSCPNTSNDGDQPKGSEEHKDHELRLSRMGQDVDVCACLSMNAVQHGHTCANKGVHRQGMAAMPATSSASTAKTRIGGTKTPSKSSARKKAAEN